jgi:hypothetical protein
MTEDWFDEEMNARIKKADEDLKHGRYKGFDNIEDVLKYLHKKSRKKERRKNGKD